MKKSFIPWILATLTAFSLFGAISASLAWFDGMAKIDEVNIGGKTEGAYFAYGDGTSAHPYGISNTRHLNNLAWLQYNGNFNVDRDNDGEPDHVYFELANDIIANEEGNELVMPPIGTEANPFVGVFDGQGYTITGLAISNDASDFSNKPALITYSQNNAKMVGFFGVIGKTSKTDGEYDASYASSDNAVKDVTLEDLEVKTTSSSTLIGLAAGFSNAEISGIKIEGDSSVNVAGNSAPTSMTGFSNLSEYGLVGYSTKTVPAGIYKQTLSTWYDAYDSSYGGTTVPALGGHTSIKDVHSRLTSIRGSTTDTHYARRQTQTLKIDGTYSSVSTENIPNSNVLHNYKDDTNYVGSFCFSDESTINSQIQQYHLTGERVVQKEITDESATGNMVFFNNAFQDAAIYCTYLFPRNNEQNNVFSATGTPYTIELSRENGWYFTEPFNLDTFTSGNANLGALYTISGGKKYFLRLGKWDNKVWARQEILSDVPTAANYQWRIEHRSDKTVYADRNKTTIYDGPIKTCWISSELNGTRYYLRYNGELTNQNVGSDALTRFCIRTKYFELMTTEPTSLTDNYDTYFPLITESGNNKAAVNNTGYVVSGSEFEPRADLKDSGSITIAKYTRSGNFNYNAATAKNDIRTINGGTDRLAKDVATYTDFSSRYTDFNPAGNDYSTYFYGFRFNEAEIDVDNLATIGKGKLNNSTFENREMPRNCIDFSLGKRGKTCFFAGTFHEGTVTAFFSLYKINRPSTTISSIDEILEIYESANGEADPYVYKTVAEPSPTIPVGYTKVFDTSWLTNPPTPQEHYIYYFEIPLNSGEYALGSVSGKGGAYLMYFDIGTSLLAGEDSITGYTITTNVSTIVYPSGVDFAISSATNDGGDTFCISIASGERGVLSFAVESNSIVVTDTSSISTYSYQNPGLGETFTVSGNSPGAMGEEEFVTTKEVHVFIKTAAGVEHSAVITVGSSYVLDGTSYATLDALISAAPVFTSTHYNALVGLGGAITLTKTAGPTFNIVPTFSSSNRKEIIVDLDVTGVTVTASAINSEYTVYKQSQAAANVMANNGSYSFT